LETAKKIIQGSVANASSKIENEQIAKKWVKPLIYYSLLVYQQL
jgi:hypothetical protein